MRRILAMLGCLATWAGAASAAPAMDHLGEIAFANSGAPAAQGAFLRGLALLHNFEYEDAAEAFRSAQKADPRFAMAYWGEAMTFNHPVWMEQDAQAARTALSHLAPTRETRASFARTPREAAYLAAVEGLYGEGPKEVRDNQYAEAMGRLHAAYPDDVDATAFYALSLLGTAHAGRDFSTYMRSAAVLEEVFPAHPQHPGVLHYLIHSYDDPIHAPLGLRAARRYGAVAAGAPHALHMTSHIFIALGMWDEVIAANIEAMRAENAGQVAKGLPLLACFHYEEWLVYGHLQKGDVKRADERIAACREKVEAKLKTHPQPAFPEGGLIGSYADMLVRRGVETGEWPAGLLPSLDDGAFVEARFNLTYGEALVSASQPARLHAAAARLRALLVQLEGHKAIPGSEAQEAQALVFYKVMAEEIAALERIADGKMAEGLAALQTAAEHEVAAPLDFGPPATPKPTLELMGDLLLAQGRPAEAADAYRRALARTPGRRLTLMGLAKAEAAAAARPTTVGAVGKTAAEHHH